MSNPLETPRVLELHVDPAVSREWQIVQAEEPASDENYALGVGDVPELEISPFPTPPPPQAVRVATSDDGDIIEILGYSAADEPAPEPETEPEIDIQEPDTYPSETDVFVQLQAAMQSCISRNLLRPITNQVGLVLGEDNAEIFNDSMFFREVSMSDYMMTLNRSISGVMPIQQFVGRILYDTDIMCTRLNDTNPLISREAMQNTRVSIQREQGTGTVERLNVVMDMPFDSRVERYLRRVGGVVLDELEVNIQTYNRSTDGSSGMELHAHIAIGEGLDSVQFLIEHLNSILDVYYKLLTRFTSWMTYSNALPRFHY